MRPQAIAFLNAETVLHEHWSDAEFWAARRSMRFSKRLTRIANSFRAEIFNSNDIDDNTLRPADWRHDKVFHSFLLVRTKCKVSCFQPRRDATGGNYLCAHLRRADFLRGREATTPSLRAAATQISNRTKQYHCDTVFISSDCTGKEFKDLKSYLPRQRLVKFRPNTMTERAQLGPGAIAIVDQIICSYARY